MRILIAEDERSLNRVIKKQLTAAGYSVDCCFDGGEAYDCLSMTEYDLAVLDVMMPVLDGFELVRRLRAVGNSTPVIFLPARRFRAPSDIWEIANVSASEYFTSKSLGITMLSESRVWSRNSFWFWVSRPSEKRAFRTAALASEAFPTAFRSASRSLYSR